MPAAYAHLAFGKKVYKMLPKEIKTIVKENKEAYLIGLHGPDLLFYYRPVIHNKINTIGEQMHHELASDFFDDARVVYQTRPNYTLLSYLIGFICHFALDSECHPYIAEYMEEREISHSRIESDFDRELMWMDGKDAVSDCYTTHLMRDLDTEEAIASVLGVSVQVVDESIKGFHSTIRFFQCESPAKATLIRNACALVGKDFIGGLVMDGCIDIDCDESTEFLLERLEKAVPTAVELIKEYTAKIDTVEGLSERFARDFE